jgi:hypothetical protein
MTVQQLCANITSYEIVEWMFFYKHEALEREKEQKRQEAANKNKAPNFGSANKSQEKFSIFDIPEEFEDELNG